MGDICPLDFIFFLEIGFADEGSTEVAQRLQQISDRFKQLEEQGVFAGKLRAKLIEPPRKKVHWDYLLEEMQWLSNDFRQERKWKMAVARKVAYAAKRQWESRNSKADRDVKANYTAIRKLAASIGREVLKFWGQVEKLAMHKHQVREGVRKKQVLDQQLDDLVGKAGRFSALIAADLQVSNEQAALPAEPVEVKPEVVIDAELQAELVRCLVSLFSPCGLEIVLFPKRHDLFCCLFLNESDQAEPEFQADESEAQDDEATLDEDEKMIDAKDTAEEVQALHEERLVFHLPLVLNIFWFVLSDSFLLSCCASQ